METPGKLSQFNSHTAVQIFIVKTTPPAIICVFVIYCI